MQATRISGAIAATVQRNQPIIFPMLDPPIALLYVLLEFPKTTVRKIKEGASSQ